MEGWEAHAKASYSLWGAGCQWQHFCLDFFFCNILNNVVLDFSFLPWVPQVLLLEYYADFIEFKAFSSFCSGMVDITRVYLFLAGLMKHSWGCLLWKDCSGRREKN